MNRGALAGALVVAAVVVGGLVYLSSGRSALEPTKERDSTPVEEPSPAAPRPAVPSPAAPQPGAARRPSSPAAAPAPEASASEADTELGTLRIETDVAGAQVFLDRQFVGTAPLTAERVKPGTHQLNVTAEGFDGIAQTIDVEPGPRDLTFRFREVTLDASLAVVHKHRIGSCKGRLVATPDGVRYDTDDKDDAFSVSLRDLETFQVDYQEKNLRIKARKGKQYNFTDPDGNADRLFVFHRDVDRVRQRLTP